MKNKSIKYIIISIIILIILIFFIILINNRKDKYSNIKKTISNTFFYLSLDEYDNMNNISDNCKMSLLFDMESFKDQRIGNLSTGQTQRVGVARCVLHDPHNYILDEATSGLDIISSQVILDFIKEERDKGKCIIYSTHYMEEAENICNRVVLINKGEIIDIGTPKEIKDKTKTNNLRDAFFKLIGGIKDEME